jgi:hypothetical protein
MTIDANRRDLERHAQDFAARAGFAYTVLDPASRAVTGCLYIYRDENAGCDAAVASWVRASHAELDIALRGLISRWLSEAWPFECIASGEGRRSAKTVSGSACRTGASSSVAPQLQDAAPSRR